MNNFFTQILDDENHFFLMAKNSKRLTHIALSSFLLPVIFLLIAGVISQILLYPIIISENQTVWIKEIYNLIVLFGLIILIIFLWIKFYEGRPISSIGFVKKDFINDYLQGFFSGFLMNSIVVGLLALFGTITLTNYGNNLTGFSAVPIILFFLFGFIIQGAAEEILSRGFIMQVIGARYRAWLGVAISTIFFALMHLGNSGINYPSMINLIIVGLLLALFVLWKGNLWFACAWHSSWNWTMGNIYGLSVSGHSDKVTMINLNTSGNELISGGTFGPEGSLITTFVILIALVYYGRKASKNSSAP